MYNGRRLENDSDRCGGDPFVRLGMAGAGRAADSACRHLLVCRVVWCQTISTAGRMAVGNWFLVAKTACTNENKTTKTEGKD